MGKYIYYPPTPDNVLWAFNWSALSLANMQNPDNVNARLTIKNKPKSGGGFENILEWEKFSLLIENISTANPFTDSPQFTLRNNYVGDQKHYVETDVFMNESKTHDCKLYTSYRNATTNEMEIVKKIYVTDGDVLNKQYEKYLFTYNKTNHIFDSQIYTNSMSSVIYNGASLLVNSPIFYFDPTNSDGYFKVKTTQGHCYFQSPIIEQTVADTDTTLFNIKNEIPNAESKVLIKQQTLISDFNYIFTQSNQSDKITLEMKTNMTKGAPTIAVTTRTPIKYELERNSGGVVTTDKLTMSSDVTITGKFLPPVKPYACARTGNTPLTENLGTSQGWSYMPTLTPAGIVKSTDFTNCFGTSDGYGFKYTGTRELRAHVCISITFFSSISTNVQWLLSQMFGAGGGYDVQCSNTIPSVTAPFNTCSLNGIVELKQNDLLRLVLSKTSSSDGTVSFLCNFSIIPIDYLT